MNNKMYLIIACIIVIIACILLLYLRYKKWSKYQKYKKDYDDKYLEVWCEKFKKHLELKYTSKEKILEDLRKFEIDDKRIKDKMSKKILKDIKRLADLAEIDNKDLIEISNTMIEKWSYKDFSDYSLYRFTIIEIQTYMKKLIDLQNEGTKN